MAVSSDFFRTLRARPLLGRTFLPGEDRPGRDDVAVIAHGLWTRRFGGAPDIVGREIALDGRPFTVVGVMPREFEFPPGGRDVWTPLVLTEADRNDRRNHSVVTVGRLRPGVTSSGRARGWRRSATASRRPIPGPTPAAASRSSSSGTSNAG